MEPKVKKVFILLESWEDGAERSNISEFHSDVLGCFSTREAAEAAFQKELSKAAEDDESILNCLKDDLACQGLYEYQEEFEDGFLLKGSGEKFYSLMVKETVLVL